MATSPFLWRLFRRPIAFCSGAADATMQFFGDLTDAVPQRIFERPQLPEQALELLSAFRTAGWTAAVEQTVESLPHLKEKTLDMLQRWMPTVLQSEATSTTEAFELANARSEEGRLEEIAGSVNPGTDDGLLSKTAEAVNSTSSRLGTVDRAIEDSESATLWGRSLFAKAVKDSDSDSDNETSASSADDSILETREDLVPTALLAEKYVIVPGAVPGKMNILFADMIDQEDHERVVLKLFSGKKTHLFMHSLKVHRQLRHLSCVCTLYDTISSPRLSGNGLVFKKGAYTFSDWLKRKQHFVVRKACLYQVADALRDLHAANIVHCDLTEDNIVFFPEDYQWKLIDLETAQKIAENPQTEISIHYAAPEIICAAMNRQPFPRVDPSRDMWALGIISFETLSETRFCDPESTLEQMADYTSEKKVRERLKAIKDDKCKELVEHLLEVDPRKRWTAEDALNSAAF